MTRFVHNGKEISQEEWDALPSKLDELLASRTPPASPSPAGWPIYSDSLGVHPEQIPEAMAEMRRHGVPTDFDTEGRAIIRDAGHKKAAAELYGLHDKNGGYRDPAPK